LPVRSTRAFDRAHVCASLAVGCDSVRNECRTGCSGINFGARANGKRAAAICRNFDWSGDAGWRGLRRNSRARHRRRHGPGARIGRSIVDVRRRHGSGISDHFFSQGNGARKSGKAGATIDNIGLIVALGAHPARAAPVQNIRSVGE
jgi:hypothetical protein